VPTCNFVRRLLAKGFNGCLVEQIYCGYSALVGQLLRQTRSNADCATSDDDRQASALNKPVLLLSIRSSWFNLDTFIKKELVEQAVPSLAVDFHCTNFNTILSANSSQ
jgi:hypothetical protein